MSSNNRSAPNDLTAKDTTFSCEFFPPRTDAGMEKLQVTQKTLHDVIKPSYYSVTFGAGGTTRDRTLETVKTFIDNNVDTAPHISCIGSTKQQINELLNEYKKLGVNRLVALRGDLPATGEPAKELLHADQLINFIREETGDHFTIEIAAYPEYHPESTSPKTDFEYFKNKVAAGANGAITQYFFNADAYYRFTDNCQNAGITIPITPGIMPITNYESLIRFSDTCGAEIPRWIRKQLEAYADDKESLQAFGVDVVSNLSTQLLDNGAPGLHFYTLNQTDCINAIWKNLAI